MKKNIIKYIAIALGAAVLTSGCNDFLNEAPILSLDSERTLSTYNGLVNATAGAYAPLASTTWYSGDRILQVEMRSGNGSKSRGDSWDSNRYFTDYEWNYNPDATYGLWSLGYYVIASANYVIDAVNNNAETILASDAGATQQDLNNLKAECLFLRAFSHMEMVLFYAQAYNKGTENPGIPVVIAVDPDLDDLPARKTVGEVYNQVVTDLLEAEKIIDPNYNVSGRGTDPRAVVTLEVIQAYLSRVYLYMSDWGNAEAYATKVINSGKYEMWEAEEYNVELFSQDVIGGEMIFEMYGTTGNSYWGSWDDISNIASPNGSYADAQVSPDLYELYEPEDVRFTNLQTDTAGKSGHLWTFKYEGKLNVAQDCNNVPILRLSEMYLNRAEARFNTGNVTGAVADLNVIRSHRKASELPAGIGISDIQKERRLELAYEGHYLLDLARWRQPVEREYYISSQNQNVPADSYRWALPIPRRELEVNKNLEQNIGYE